MMSRPYVPSLHRSQRLPVTAADLQVHCPVTGSHRMFPGSTPCGSQSQAEIMFYITDKYIIQVFYVGIMYKREDYFI